LSVECPQVSLLGFQQAGSQVSWSINNGQAQPIQVSDIRVSRPDDNPLVGIRLGGVSLGNPEAAGPGSATPTNVALADEAKTLASGAIVPLVLQFTYADAQPGYAIVVEFNDGACTVKTVW
jgi:hypothetical protein